MDHDDQPTDEFETFDTAGEGDGARVAEANVIAAGRRLGGRYRLERMLGHGGMAGVWLAGDERLDRSVAVKVLSDTLAHDREYLGRFRREAQVAAGLQHPNLVPVYDFGAGERPYLVMELIPGGDLAELLRAGQAPDARELAEELLAALRHIHAAGVLHRDIKPQNVLLDADGRARLTDFGIAQPRDATSFTRTGQVIGTESYLAPEVLAGAPASERSDLYALGVVLAAVARATGADADLWDLIESMRAKDPGVRPASAAVALKALQTRTEPTAIVAETTEPFDIEPPPPPPPGPATAPRSFEPTPPTRRSGSSGNGRRIAIGALAAVIVAILVGVVLASGGDDGKGGPNSLVGDRGQQSAEGGKSDSGAAESSTTTPSTTESTTASSTTDTAPTEPVSNDGAALNQQGFELVQSGDYAGAIPLLQKAVKSLSKSGDEQTYNYALYNLATAYTGNGQPEEAIPLLQERLAYPDQTETVQAALDQACADAGVDCSSSSGDTSGGTDAEPPGQAKPKPEKPDKGPKPK